MLGAATVSVREWIRRRGELVPLGFNWAFVIFTDVSIVGIVLIAALQRPATDLPATLLAIAVAVTPFALFLVLGIQATFKAPVLCASGTAATAIFLFATSTPVTADFAPLLLVLTVGVVGALTNMLGGLLATAVAAAVLVAASAWDRLDVIALYLSFVGMGWLVGFLMHTQQKLIIKQQLAQAQLAAHAAADERRRIAREVHDVIAHSLSITLLHTTAARRGLQQDRDVDDAIDALEQAEQLGRQAMADIRRTVGLLDGAPMKTAPEPGASEIPSLVEEFRRAGLKVDLDVEGRLDRASAAVGLALYRITQESLANVAKHAPEAKSVVRLVISRTSAALTVVNQLPIAVAAPACEGRGLRGMRQRIELLGGRIDIGPSEEGWSVHADIPLDDVGGWRPPWCPS
ncbi:two-component sensor histidine kinase [Mycolicibacterium celeriflavum]|uniref:sensor histidine kinase n=1 Tax=Mycolicibacterium celeriflavum TaxID=1249101 RepID=UPI0008004F66|nr:histidine kinase [Mycolicibacterium celeriflavum]OBG18903.1 two-component sensor histidine kinase [Mycolicibacterium celeriflavum]